MESQRQLGIAPVYIFNNSGKGKAAQNSTLASVSEYGQIEVEKFRLEQDARIQNQSRVEEDRKAQQQQEHEREMAAMKQAQERMRVEKEQKEQQQLALQNNPSNGNGTIKANGSSMSVGGNNADIPDSFFLDMDMDMNLGGNIGGNMNPHTAPAINQPPSAVSVELAQLRAQAANLQASLQRATDAVMAAENGGDRSTVCVCR